MSWDDKKAEIDKTTQISCCETFGMFCCGRAAKRAAAVAHGGLETWTGLSAGARLGLAELGSGHSGGLLCLASSASSCVFNRQPGRGGARPQFENPAAILALALKNAVPTALSAIQK